MKNAPTASEYLAMSKAHQLEARAAHGHRWYIQLTRSPEFQEALRAGRPSPARRAPSRAAVKRTVDRMVTEAINDTTESARPEAARRAEARALARRQRSST